MIEEPLFKARLLDSLNERNPGWVDGDKEPGNGKRVDVLNHALKVAIEIKDDTKYQTIPDGIVRITNLTLMNQRLSDHVNSANNKFKLYPGYKTVVLLRTEYIMPTIKYAIEGLDQYKKVGDSLVYAGKVGKYSEHGKNEVGSFLILAHEAGFFVNYLAKPERVIQKEELKALTGWEIKDL